MANLWVISGVVVAGVLALVGLYRPYFGMLVFLAIHFIQPGELIPLISHLRIELVYGCLLLGVILIRHLLRPKASRERDRIVFGALAMLAVAGLSVPFAIWRGGALDSTIELAKLIAVLYLIRTLIESEKDLRGILWLMMILLGWYSISSLIAYRNGGFYYLRYGNMLAVDRAMGINSLVGAPNELAGMVLALLPFLVALIRTSRRIWSRITLLVLATCALAALVLTGSRTAVLSLLALAVYYVLQFRHKLLTLAGCTLLMAIIWVSMPSAYKQRYLTVKSYAEGGQLDASNEFRLEVWAAGWKMFLDHPVIGVGAGQFSTAFALLYSKEHHQWMNPHDLLLQVICELGVIGLIAFTYFVVQVRRAINIPLHIRNSRFKFHYEIAVACDVMFLGVLLLSITGHTMYRPFWYLLGGLAAANLSLVRAAQQKTVAPIREAAGRAPESWVGEEIEVLG